MAGCARGRRGADSADPGATRIIDAIRDGDCRHDPDARYDRKRRDQWQGRGRDDAAHVGGARWRTSTTARPAADRGADPKMANEAGATALMWAIPDLDKVALLLDRGADLNATFGRRPDAADDCRRHCRQRPRSKLLLDTGAQPSAAGRACSDRSRHSPRPHMPATKRRFSCCSRAGANRRWQARRARLCLARQLRQLRRGAPEGSAAAAPHGRRDASCAAVRRWRWDIKFLLERGADRTRVTSKAASLLMLAASSDAIPADSRACAACARVLTSTDVAQGRDGARARQAARADPGPRSADESRRA